MIGQHHLLDTIDNLISNDNFPRFTIIVGGKHSGRYTLVHEIKRRLGAYLVECGSSIDDVRDSIENSYHCGGLSVYLFRDADRMSLRAKNALLKITEEPPKDVRFILTVQTLENVLPTLVSRATVFYMEPYTPEEVKKVRVEVSPEILAVCDCPGMVLDLQNYGETFIPFCNDVIDYIQKVSLTNAFKILLRFQFKEGSEGYDPELFLRVLKNVLLSRLSKVEKYEKEDLQMFARMIIICEKYRHELSLSGLKKDATMGMWLLEMRGE